jgi:hypothetical protein
MIAELELRQLNLDTWLVQIELKERYLETASALEMFAW